LTIGRLDKEDPFANDIAILESSTNYISTHHGTFECLIINGIAKWYLRDGQWYLKDNIKGWYLSRNGIAVNSKKIDKNGILLENNDVIKIAKVTMKIISRIC
jgi:hypothetical protein